METKPFDLQSPEQIAKDFMGNKQRIAAAAQAGSLDPTAAVMAGMFIDRMRSAQMQEQQPASTVAQDVLAPPMAPPAGLGMLPPGAAGGAPPTMGAPPPMAPPPMGPASMGPPPMGAPPAAPPPMGMAAGGMVAFNGEGPAVVPPADTSQWGIEDYIAEQTRYATPQTGARDAVTQYWQQQMSPEAMASQKKNDLWSTLAQIGFGMAGNNSPHFLQAVGQSASAALPGMRQAAQERRATQRQGLGALADIEGRGNADRRGQYDSAAQGRNASAGVRENRRTAEEQRAHDIARDERKMQHDLDMLGRQLAARGGGGGGSGGGGGGGTEMERYAEMIYASLLANPANKDKSPAMMRRQAMQTAMREMSTARGGGGGGGGGGFLPRGGAVPIADVTLAGGTPAQNEAASTPATRAPSRDFNMLRQQAPAMAGLGSLMRGLTPAGYRERQTRRELERNPTLYPNFGGR